jgi:hypothetical protein
MRGEASGNSSEWFDVSENGLVGAEERDFYHFSTKVGTQGSET